MRTDEAIRKYDEGLLSFGDVLRVYKANKSDPKCLCETKDRVPTRTAELCTSCRRVHVRPV